jgi:hypothetical protein
VATVAATVAVAAPAFALEFCVTGHEVRQQRRDSVGADAEALNTALTNAQGAPGKDRVVAGPGT